MKTAMYILAGLTCLLASCVDSDKNLSIPPTGNATDLVIPGSFSWSTTHIIAPAINVPRAVSAPIYLDEVCSEQIANPAVPEGDSNTPLEVPSANNAIRIKYPVTNGGYEIQKISIKSKTPVRSEPHRWEVDCLLPDSVTPIQGGNYSAYTYRPAKDRYGTLMFKDMWPELGDYDFNGFVIGYQTQVTWGTNGGWSNNYLDVTISLELRATGGGLSYRFCIRLSGKATTMQGNLIISPTIANSQITNSTFESTTQSIDIEFLENISSPIFALAGLEKLKGPDETQLYNIQVGKLTPSSEEAPTVVFPFKLSITPNNYNFILSNFSPSYDFDYFLQNPKNGREIYFVEFKPTELYKDYETDRKEVGKSCYCNKDGFVWVLKVPVETGWAVERQQLLNAYLKFKSWLGTGGNELEEGSNVDRSRWHNYPETSSLYISPQKH